MLESITIRNIALIEEATIRFHNGMQVLTGETGAGKSIVVDSVNLILGGRADRDLIRTGCERASVEALFNARNNITAKQFLEQEGIEYDGQIIALYREISVSGKNICRICGVIVPVSKFRNLASVMMDIHGQSDHQFLTDPDKQLVFLDQTGGEDHQILIHKTEADHDRFILNHRAYAKLVRQNENREARMNSLIRDLDELRQARVEPGEANRLLERRKQLEKDEKTAESLREICDIFSGNEGKESALTLIKQISGNLKSLAERNEAIRVLSEQCESVYFELEDIAYQIYQFSEKTEYEPGAMEKNNDRLSLIHRLEKKHAVTADELPDVLAEIEKEYQQLTELEDQISKMSADHKRLLSAYRCSARELSESRKHLASRFEDRIMKELDDLGMAETQFRIDFKKNETGRPLMPTPYGDDRIEFLISPNPGEPLKPLAKIASGGELSRLMLAVKTLESSHSGVESMVFDEIDTGISGRMAQVVAEKLISISRQKQVICVTHLPQIAAAADYHFLVSKSVTEGRTNTYVTELSRAERSVEIGRMISGADGNNRDSCIYADSLLDSADALKQKFNKNGMFIS